MSAVKLIALDDEDLSVISTHLQDAVVRVGDLAYLASERRFAMVVNRFDWSNANTQAEDYARLRSGLRFEKVASAQVSGIDLHDKNRVLSLLAITFSESDHPSGFIEIVFSGRAAIRLEVECVEAELRDLGAQWATNVKPTHSEEESGLP